MWPIFQKGRSPDSEKGYKPVHGSEEDEDEDVVEEGEAGERRSDLRSARTRPRRTLFIALGAVVAILALLDALSYIPSSSPDYPDPTLDTPLRPQDYTSDPGRTISLQWNVTSGLRRPDGVEKTVYLINDAFPGPTIEARSGDWLEVDVFNALEDEGLAIHWHGLHMRGANAMDGAVGITQDSIAPGTHFVYRFQISDTQHGTFWYHAHDRVQRGDGLYGGLIVHEANAFREDAPEQRLLLIGDWYHQSSKATLDRYMRPGAFGNEPVPDSILISGKGAYNCPDASPARPVDCRLIPDDEVPVLAVERGRRYRYRVVNTGTLAGISLYFPGAHLAALEVDGGGNITPAPANSIGVLYPGQRVDFTLEWESSLVNASFEIKLDDENFRDPNPALTATQRFPVKFMGATESVIASVDSFPRLTHDLLTAVGSQSPVTSFHTEADLTMTIYTTTRKMAHLDNIPFGYINQTSWKESEHALIGLPRSQWDEHQLVPFIPGPSPGKWIELVINNIDDGGHPFHLHGHSFYVLQTNQRSSFWGSYNPFADAEPPGGPFNLENPVKRDTVFVPARGYVVIRFYADNPGIWFAHCHLLTHQASGMAMSFQVGGDNETGFG